IYYSNVRYSRDRVRDKLASDFERFKSNDATLASLRKTLDAREKGVQAAKDKLDAMLAAKRQLEVDVENLEARLKMVEVAKTSANFKVDESQLSRTKELVKDIETRIKVQERMLYNFAGEQPFDDIQIDEPAPTKDVTEEITEYFGGARPANALVGSGN
ncbi:MAG: hypothetical protein KDA41_02405, partial [Planctomycetales bacterium]|nr:hypothetical protein [Planctomycetales bacterium]